MSKCNSQTATTKNVSFFCFFLFWEAKRQQQLLQYCKLVRRRESYKNQISASAVAIGSGFGSLTVLLLIYFFTAMLMQKKNNKMLKLNAK